MSKFMQKELDRLEHQLLALSALVQESIHKAVQAFQERDVKLAEEVTRADREIDRMEVEIEEECLKLLALYQPVAIDLRFIVAALKINNDLERVGDLAKNIGKRVAIMAGHPEVEIPFDFRGFASQTLEMLRRTIDAFINLDLEQAYEITRLDQVIDGMHHQAEETISQAIRQHPKRDIPYLQILWVSRCLERIGDHATNIAEDVIYLMEGEIIRHREKLKRPRTSE